MKWLAGICAVAVIATATTARASSEVTSGPQKGDKISAFNVTKCAGAPNDEVKVGDNLCYRCKYGAKPMVMVFTRKADDQVVELVKKLDKAVEENSDKHLKAFVNFLGDRDESEKSAKRLAADADNVPMVVPDEAKNGPDNYGINPDAVVTVIVAREGKVVTSHGYTGTPDSDDIKQIMHDVNQALN